MVQLLWPSRASAPPPTVHPARVASMLSAPIGKPTNPPVDFASTSPMAKPPVALSMTGHDPEAGFDVPPSRPRHVANHGSCVVEVPITERGGHPGILQKRGSSF